MLLLNKILIVYAVVTGNIQMSTQTSIHSAEEGRPGGRQFHSEPQVFIDRRLEAVLRALRSLEKSRKLKALKQSGRVPSSWMTLVSIL